MKSLKIEIKWAVIFVVMMLLWMVMERVAGLHGENIDKHAIVSNFVAIPAITNYVLALLDKRRKDYNGVMSYKQGFFTGLYITLFVTALTPLTQYVTSTIISPDYFANVTRYSVSNGWMKQEEAEAYFNLKSYIIQATIGSLVMGIVTSLIVAVFTRKSAAATRSV